MMAIKFYFLIIIFTLLQRFSSSQEECITGTTSSIPHSLNSSQCKRRSTGIGFKCCLLSYESGDDDVSICYPIQVNADLTDIPLNEGLPENFKIDCIANIICPSLYFIALFIFLFI